MSSLKIYKEETLQELSKEELNNLILMRKNGECTIVLKRVFEVADTFLFECEETGDLFKLCGIRNMMESLVDCKSIDEVVAKLTKDDIRCLYATYCCCVNRNLEYISYLSENFGFIDCKVPECCDKWGVVNPREFMKFTCFLGLGFGQLLLPENVILDILE